jgi:membrane protein implicated in regulation of membrane protease activity
MSELPSLPGSGSPAESKGRIFLRLLRILGTLLLIVLAPLALCAALTHWLLGASWLASCLWSPLALVALLVWLWIQKYGQSGSYGAYQAIQKQLERKP